MARCLNPALSIGIKFLAGIFFTAVMGQGCYCPPEAGNHLGLAGVSAPKHHRFNTYKNTSTHDVKIYQKLP